LAATTSQVNSLVTHPAAELAAMKALMDDRALIYDAGEHGDLEPIASYPCSDGERHEVCINQHPDLDWRVIDLSPDGSATLVGRLDGLDDLRRQAVACAEDYATQCRLFHAGWREHPPMLRPKQMQMNSPARTTANNPEIPEGRCRS
jgi:hypothetical protein